MNILAELRSRFRSALQGLRKLAEDERAASADDTDPDHATLERRFRVVVHERRTGIDADSLGEQLSDERIDELVELVRPSQDPKFGDYQANLAMPLGKQLGCSPRDVAQAIRDRLDVADMCHPPEVAGPGFINLRLADPWLVDRLTAAVGDERLGVAPAAEPRTYVIDYSAPNVAKPMHVGHVRSTVIGDSLYRTLAFLGHRVISDNHIGDWGTQFGMILYGWHHFRDEAAYRADAVGELARLYRLVNTLVEYHEARQRVPQLKREMVEAEQALDADDATRDPKNKQVAKEARRRRQRLDEMRETLAELQAKVAAVDDDPTLAKLAAEHAEIGRSILEETALLHAGDMERRGLWAEFMPACKADMEAIYSRLGVRFDETLGESFYHDRLADVVDDLRTTEIAEQSEGAWCIFFRDADDPEVREAPMIVQKQDGAFLYATSDLATIRYRVERWNPDAMLYVVDFRQGLHFKQLFAAARRWGYGDVELEHVRFGTVLGSDGRPFKTRAGDTVGLSGLLDEAVHRAAEVVAASDDAKPGGPELSAGERRRIAEAVGIAALKYADLSQNRTSDYVFSYEKMLAMNGNTATYMQYAYARVRSIFARGQVDVEALRRGRGSIELATPAERALGLEILRFGEALSMVATDYRPNHLTSYLFELANRYSTFFEQCPVLKAETERLRTSRLLLCDLTACTLQKGLALLGIATIEKM